MYKHNKLTKFLLFVLTLILSCCLFSCTNSTPPTNNPETPLEPPQNYQKFDLSLDNFSHFFDFSYTRGVYGTYNPSVADTYTIKGVLTFAYYENVIVTLDVTYTYPSGIGNTDIVKKGTYTLSLNAAGSATFRTDDPALLQAINCTNYSNTTQEQITVKSVTGTVILFQ
ncbi:MAG: hypothetical protein IKD03_06075 [Clostridia bacterium]|nr:hypothetical protein [Clostridia bacterium]